MGQSGNHITRGIVFAVLGALFWGFSGTCASVLTTGYGAGVFWIVCMRLVTAGPIFLVIALIFNRDRLFALFRNPRMLAHAFVFAVVGVILVMYSYTASIKFTNTGTALLLQQLGLPLIMLIACIRARRLPAQREAFALILALLGAACIATQGSFTSLAISEIGLFWGLVSALALAGYNLLPMKLLDEYGSFVTNGVGLTMGAIVVVPFVRPWESVPPMSIDGWVVLGCIILFGTVMAYVMYLQGVKDAGPVKASLIAVLEPVSGMAISAAWIGDVISTWDILGCVLICAMMVLVSLPAKADREASKIAAVEAQAEVQGDVALEAEDSQVA